jgi:hypothetical protein
MGTWFVLMGAQYWAQTVRMRSWKPIEATILSSDVSRIPHYEKDSNGRRYLKDTEYHVRVVCQFSVDGKVYESRVWETWPDDRMAQDELRQYPGGSQRNIIYDPKDPNHIALKASTGGGFAFAVSLVMGILAILFGRWLFRRKPLPISVADLQSVGEADNES